MVKKPDPVSIRPKQLLRGVEVEPEGEDKGPRFNGLHIFAGYLIWALLTFGYVAAEHECMTDKFEKLSCVEQAGWFGAWAGLFWPVYWFVIQPASLSWTMFEAMEGDDG